MENSDGAQNQTGRFGYSRPTSRCNVAGVCRMVAAAVVAHGRHQAMAAARGAHGDQLSRTHPDPSAAAVPLRAGALHAADGG